MTNKINNYFDIINDYYKELKEKYNQNLKTINEIYQSELKNFKDISISEIKNLKKKNFQKNFLDLINLINNQDYL